MGAKMEAEEREYREALFEKEQGEAGGGEAHEAITALQEQLETQRHAHGVKNPSGFTEGARLA